MTKNTTQYRQIMKGTALFGGVQIFQVLISILRGKIIAYTLGPEGMGISNLFVSSLAIFITVSSLGCNMSSVRHISLHKEDSDINRLVRIIHRLFIGLSLLGLFLTVCFSNILSQMSFKSKEYTRSFIFLSLYVFFSIYNSGNISILQGLGKNRNIASISLFSAIAGLLGAAPILFFFHSDGIVWVLFLAPFLSSVYSFYLIYKVINEDKEHIRFRVIIETCLPLIKLGIVMVCASLIGNFTVYFINMIITRLGSVTEVGLYQAGNSITNQCVGLVFTAMGIDYFPRLSAVCNDKDKTNQTVNSQGIITVLISFPILTVLMGFVPLAIRILLTSEFLKICDFIRILVLGMQLKAISFCMGYISFSKGDKKVFLFFEGIWGNFQNLILSYLGYKYGGLTGLAYSYVIHYFLYTLLVCLITHFKFEYVISLEFFILGIVSFSVLFILYLCNILFSHFVIGNIVVSAIVCIYCLYALNKRCDILALLKKKGLRRNE